MTLPPDLGKILSGLSWKTVRDRVFLLDLVRRQKEVDIAMSCEELFQQRLRPSRRLSTLLSSSNRLGGSMLPRRRGLFEESFNRVV